tara:strand:- start:23337 stop:24302 length:966 start_codon:yes stop_codon:yes gene_type:complete
MKKYLIVGGTGSLGNQLIKRLLKDSNIRVFSRDEAKHWSIKNKYSNKNLSFSVGDIRDYERLEQVICEYNPEIIIIAAALKQVDTCELSPEESIKTNIQGPKNIIKVIEKHYKNLNIETVLMVSTDKACEPVNVYGMCKSISERVVTSQSSNKRLKHIKFIGTRYGNVLDSRGSILPLFRQQAKEKEFLTITDERMTRFVMTLKESVDLITDAIKFAKSGEIYLPKLKSMLIKDLSNIFSEKYNKKVKTIGIRPGEKIHEKLISESESMRIYEKNQYYVLKPLTENSRKIVNDLFEYTSNDEVLTKDELSKYLEGLGLIYV